MGTSNGIWTTVYTVIIKLKYSLCYVIGIILIIAILRSVVNQLELQFLKISEILFQSSEHTFHRN